MPSMLRRLIWVLFTIVIGLTACSNMHQKENQTKTADAAIGPTATIFLHQLVVATRDLPTGITISEDMVTLCTWSVTLIPELGIANVDIVIGRKTRVEIPRGTLVIATQLLPEPANRHPMPATQTVSFPCPSMNNRSPIILADKEILPGETIVKESIRMAAWPQEAIPRNAVNTDQDVIGKTALSLIPEGTIILVTQVGVP